MFGKIYINNDVLQSAMNSKVTQNQMIQNNIANVDTPGYVGRDIEFGSVLSGAISQNKSSQEILDLKPKMVSQSLAKRLDGNTVDMNIEMAKLYQVSIEFDALAGGVMNNYKKLNLVLNSGK